MSDLYETVEIRKDLLLVKCDTRLEYSDIFPDRENLSLAKWSWKVLSFPINGDMAILEIVYFEENKKVA